MLISTAVGVVCWVLEVPWATDNTSSGLKNVSRKVVFGDLTLLVETLRNIY